MECAVQDNFASCLSLVLVSEGGFVNNVHDSGGATNKGVTQRVYDAYRRYMNQPTGSVKFITTAEVSSIYRRQYWDAVRGDDLPAGMDYAVFDEAVNSGPVKAIGDLQRAVGVKADGQFGLVTLTAVRNSSPKATINILCDLRLGFLRRLTSWKYFGAGWSNRVAAVRAAALRMAS
jgi:lysozyme family protein